ncbi:MAG: gas vesicle protein GvpD P-loop domain-containing protein [Candidatus Jordarchaeum sp.]|uniref:gas vesicle protein GvpD P-loop domain-containing protein n=1 Tax=Candidatus Jordarchaeum sp. TaxID=2823881 RepID=UPI00404A03B2
MGIPNKLIIENIPLEVMEAFNHQKSYKLLVKGAPGTGKTLFALIICKFLNQRGPALYLSSRVTPEELYATYSWVRELIPSKNVLDATNSKHQPPRDIALAFRYVEKPAFIQAIYEICSQIPKTTAIIVDSFEAIKENLQISREDYALESSIIDISRMTETNLIIVSENDCITPLDYLVDGIVKQVKRGDGMFIRVSEIQKLRGENIKNPKYLFTLQGGRYQVLPPQYFTLGNLIKMEKEKRFEQIKNVEGKTSSGLYNLDIITAGGYSYGSINLIEVHRRVGEAYDYFYLPTIYNHALNGVNVLLIPPSGISAQVMREMIEPVIGEEKFRNHINVIDFQMAEESGAEKEEPWITTLGGGDLSKDLQIMYNKANALRKGQKSILVVISADTLESIYGYKSKEKGDFIAMISRGLIEMKQRGDTVLCLAKYGQKKLIDYINHISDNHFSVVNVEGPVLIHGVFPYFPAMYPTVERSKNGFRVELIPIV